MKRNLLVLISLVLIVLSNRITAQDTIIIVKDTEITDEDILHEEEDTIYYDEEYDEDELPEPRKKSGYIGMFKIGLQFSFPSSSYRHRTVRTGAGFDLGYIGSTKNKNFFAGGGFTYHFYDAFNTQYIANDREGFLVNFNEWLYNQQFSFYGEGRYMPDISSVFQPYLAAQVGLRYRYTQVTLQNVTRDNQESSFVDTKTWVMQYGVGAGCIIRIKRLMFEISGYYVETQAGSHLLRLPDWRTIDGTYTTDFYKSYRDPIQEFVFHLGMIFLIN